MVPYRTIIVQVITIDAHHKTFWGGVVLNVLLKSQILTTSRFKVRGGYKNRKAHIFFKAEEFKTNLGGRCLNY